MYKIDIEFSCYVVLKKITIIKEVVSDISFVPMNLQNKKERRAAVTEVEQKGAGKRWMTDPDLVLLLTSFPYLVVNQP